MFQLDSIIKNTAHVIQGAIFARGFSLHSRIHSNYRTAQNFDGGNIDEFDEFPAICQWAVPGVTALGANVAMLESRQPWYNGDHADAVGRDAVIYGG